MIMNLLYDIYGFVAGEFYLTMAALAISFMPN